jgi:hypothetical protein
MLHYLLPLLDGLLSAKFFILVKQAFILFDVLLLFIIVSI